MSSRGSSRPELGKGGQDCAHFLFVLIEIQHHGEGDTAGATQLPSASSSEDKTHVKTQHPPARLHMESSCWEPTPGWGGGSFLPKFNPCVGRTYASLHRTTGSPVPLFVCVCACTTRKEGVEEGESQGLACRDIRGARRICEAPQQLRT